MQRPPRGNVHMAERFYSRSQCSSSLVHEKCSLPKIEQFYGDIIFLNIWNLRFYFLKSWIVQLYILFGFQGVQYITCPQLRLFNLETPKHTNAQWANVPEMYQYPKNTIYLPLLTSFQTEIDFVELFDKFDPRFPVGLIGVPTVFLPVGGLAPNHPHLPGRP